MAISTNEEQSLKSLRVRQAQAGFTLIEVMTVVAIISILAAVAIPAYVDYSMKAKIGAVMNVADSVKTAIGICVHENGGVQDGCTPDDKGTTLGMPKFNPTKEVAEVKFTAGSAKSRGTLELKLNQLGSGVDAGSTITFTECGLGGGTTNVTWNISTSVAESANIAHREILRGNPPACV